MQCTCEPAHAVCWNWPHGVCKWLVKLGHTFLSELTQVPRSENVTVTKLLWARCYGNTQEKSMISLTLRTPAWTYHGALPDSSLHLTLLLNTTDQPVRFNSGLLCLSETYCSRSFEIMLPSLVTLSLWCMLAFSPLVHITVCNKLAETLKLWLSWWISDSMTPTK